MAAYSDTELEALVSDLESDLVERKESAADGRKVRRNVCAFANDLPGNGRPGVVLVGVRDDGSCASLPIDDALLTGLANIRGEGAILPLPSITVQKRVLRGCEVAVVSVEPSADTPVRYQGRVWVRAGPSVREGSVEDERLLTERRRAADLPFDSRAVNGAHVSDLEQDFVRNHYLPNAVAPEVLERNTRAIEHQLRSLLPRLPPLPPRLDVREARRQRPGGGSRPAGEPHQHVPGRRGAGRPVGGRSRRWDDPHLPVTAPGRYGRRHDPSRDGAGARNRAGRGRRAAFRGGDELTSQWPACLDRRPRAFRVLSAISRALHGAAERIAAGLILMDVDPNLGALNRAVLVNADHVVVPLAADLYSIRGLHNLGPTLRRWREEWSERRERNPVPDLDAPRGDMRPIGYVVLQHAVRLNRPVLAYERWMERIPGAYRDFVVGKPARTTLSMDEDEHCLATLRHYRSLMPLAQEARKPMFALKPADGAIGGHANAVQRCYRDFRALARTVARRCGVTIA